MLSSEFICMTMSQTLIMHRDANGHQLPCSSMGKLLPVRRQPLPPPPSRLSSSPTLPFPNPNTPPPTHPLQGGTLDPSTCGVLPSSQGLCSKCYKREGILFESFPDSRFPPPTSHKLTRKRDDQDGSPNEVKQWILNSARPSLL